MRQRQAVRPLRIAIAGAGLVGKDHLRMIQNSPACELAAIIDPSPHAQQLATECDVTYAADLASFLSSHSVDGIILATPNPLHQQQAQQCLAAGIPALIEKPVTHTLAAGQQLLEQVLAAKTPMMVGHHRMHSPIMQQAKQVIDSGRLGQLVAVNGSALFYKPDDYFTAGVWRTQKGGGPILINMIHEIGNLRYLCGEVVTVQAAASTARRGFEVEDTVGILLTFDSGVMGTFLLSDIAVSTRSWEQTAQENPYFTHDADEDCYHIAGTKGSLSIPTFRLKYFDGEEPSWTKAFHRETLPLQRRDPLAEQLSHFCQVIRGEVDPLVSVYDGLQNLRVTEAINLAAHSGETIVVESVGRH